MADDTYRYRAFISYRHVERDRQWARWLIERLETFRTPRALVQKGVAPRIGHLFRDDDEIPASGSLSRQIEDALRQSEYLIVVCSPRTPHSGWVRREVEMFQKLGRQDRILALLTEGEPAEAFPPELLRTAHEHTGPDGIKTVLWENTEPIAADVREHREESAGTTQQRALLRIAAALLGVTYDDLAMRDRQRVVQRQRIWGVAAAAVLVAAGAGGYAYWNYNSIHTRYYRDYGTHWGVPFGIGEISADAASRRAVTYAIDTLRGATVEMRRENGSRGLVPLTGDGIDGEYWDAGADKWHFPYPEAHAVEIDVYGQKPGSFQRHDRELRVENFNWQPDGSAVVSFKNPAGGAVTLQGSETRVRASLSGGSARRSMVTLYRLQFTPQGYVAKRLFQTVWGAESRDAEGRSGRSYEYDRQGRVVALRNLDAQARVAADKRGIAEIRRYYAPQGELISAEWRDARGILAVNSLGIAILRQRLDASGNPIETAYLNAGGKPVPRIGVGFARMRREFDYRGNRIGERYFGPDGKSILRADTGVAAERFGFDNAGNAMWQRFFGLDDKPVLRSDVGIAGVAYKYDRYGNVTQQDYSGIDRKPVLRTDIGIARLAYRYDSHSNEIEDRYFGVDGKPVLQRQGRVAGSSQGYNDRDDLTEQHYFGMDGKPSLRADLGFWRVVLKYDERGNEAEEDYFGTDSKPISRADLGFARETLKYDEHGNEIEEQYFGADSKSVARRDTGIARVTAQYDDRGNQVEEAYFGADGMPATNTIRNAAKIRLDYNEHGDLKAIERYGVRGTLLSKQPVKPG